MSAGFFSQPTSAKPTVVLSDDEESDEENTKSDPAITADEESSAMIRKMMSNKVPLLFLFIILYDVRNEHNTHRILEDMLIGAGYGPRDVCHVRSWDFSFIPFR
jgi:hypothetical protein